MYFMLLLLAITLVKPFTIDGFSLVGCSITLKKSSLVCHAKNEEDNEKKKGFFGEFLDVFKNLDDVADDFFYKRMGKGEIFYGKRRYKPSGDVEGEYQGLGLSDKLKIDMAREYREAWLEEKKMRDEMRMLREEKERRDASR